MIGLRFQTKKYVIFAVGMVLFFLFFRRINIHDFQLVKLVDPTLIFLILIANVLVLLLKVWRWRFLLSQFNIRLSNLRLFKSVSSGFYLGLVSPGTSGEFARLLRVPIKTSYGISTIILEKIADIVVLFCFSSIGLLLLFVQKLNVFYSIILPLILIIVFVSILLRTSYIGGRGVQFIGNKLKLSQIQLNDIVFALKERHVILVSIIISIFLWIIPGIQYYLVCRAMTMDIDFRALVGSFYGPYLAGIISMIPLGLGVFDFGTSQVLSRVCRYSTQLSNISVLLFRLSVTLPLIFFGFVCFILTLFGNDTDNKERGSA